jgi:UDP-N-acetylmuramoylalanine--D-glutamate ligase
LDRCRYLRSGWRINLADKKVTIFGMARSGIAAAKRLNLLGAKVMITEVKPDLQIDLDLEKSGISFEFGGHSEGAIDTDLIIVSPGIHLDIPILKKAKKKKIPIISEIEMAYRLLKKPIIAVTGTNGKTTTTILIGEMLKAGGKKVAVAGNIGNPLIAVDDTDLDYIVAEISSYQLESIKEFRPKISVVLNIQEDHLERHHTLENYIKQKEKVFINQQGDDYLVYNKDDSAVVEMAKKAKAKLVPFSKSDSTIITLKPESIKIPGRHNLENALAAAQVVGLCGVDKKVVLQVLKEFPGVEHRIEFVSTIKGIKFYNDSKATNPDSTLVALDTFEGKGIVLILGGKDKGVSLDKLCQKVKKLVKKVILVGESRERFKAELLNAEFNDIKMVVSFEEAVKRSLELSKRGEIVLLSPACSSFDMFKDYEERGKVFKEEVNKLA